MKRRPLLIILLVIAGVIALPTLYKGYLYLNSPKFSAINYTRTNIDNRCLAIVTDAVCSTTYIYKANGREEPLVRSVISDLQKHGYALSTHSNDNPNGVVCGMGDSSDLYSFVKTKDSHKHPAGMYVNFSHPGENPTTLPFATIGCANVEGNYTVDVSVIKAQD